MPPLKRAVAITTLFNALCLLASCSDQQDRGSSLAPLARQPWVANKLEQQSQASMQIVANSGAKKVAGQHSQILFGDLHVHTTFSPDAFIMSVPLYGRQRLEIAGGRLRFCPLLLQH